MKTFTILINKHTCNNASFLPLQNRFATIGALVAAASDGTPVHVCVSNDDQNMKAVIEYTENTESDFIYVLWGILGDSSLDGVSLYRGNQEVDLKGSFQNIETHYSI